MNEAQDKKPLFPEFEPVSAETWEARIRKDLKDISPDTLLWHTPEGITVKPFYTRQDLPENLARKPDEFPYVRGAKTGDNCWEITQTFYVRKDCRPFIDKAVNALRRGADGIHFILKENIEFDFGYLLGQEGVAGASISFTFPVSPEAYLQQYLDCARKNLADISLLKGFIQFLPIDDVPYHLPPYGCMACMLDLVKETPNLYPITINGQQFSNRGGSITQEIALVLSAAVSVLERAEKEEISLETIVSHMQFHVTAGTNYFFEIAKLRALRLLWSTIVSSYGLPGELASRLRIHVSTSRWYHTVFDPYMNLLRATTEAMSAVLGGCDSLSVAPFDKLYKKSDEFSERISRNIGIILKEEAYLDKAIDPAAGSYYLETLTQEIAANTWKFFQELEEIGGFKSAFQSGFISAEIKGSAEVQFKALTSREQVLVGTNKFPDQKEKVPFDPEKLMQSKYFDTSRAAYPFEVMRLASELHYRKKKKKARAIIAVIGTKINEHIHATFAKEFFDCANFETHVFHFENVTDATKAIEKAEARVVVLSGSEDQYEHFDEELTERLKSQAEKPVLILAASPQHMQDEMTTKGFDDYIFHGCDIDTIINCIHTKVLLQQDEPLD